MTLRVDGIERRRLLQHPISGRQFEGGTRTLWEGAMLAIYSTAAAPQPAQVRTTLALVEDRLVIESAIDRNGRRTLHRFTYRRVEH